jgi:hypothetical protein
MLFRTFEPYNDDINKDSNINNECFICYDYAIDDNVLPIQLRKQQFYIRNCTCNGYIHKKCLYLWIDNNHSCPICRNKIIRYNSYKINICVDEYFHKIIFLCYFVFGFYFMQEIITLAYVILCTKIS